MTNIYLHFRDGLRRPKFQYRTMFNIDLIVQYVEARRQNAEDMGENEVEGSIHFFAEQLLDSADGNGNDIDAAAFNLVSVYYLYLTVFKDFNRQQLEEASIECSLDENRKKVAMHLVLPGNPLDLPHMCFSAHVDSFLADQREILAITNATLSRKAGVIDELVVLFDELVESIRESINQRKELHPLLVGFAMSIRGDIAPAVALAMGGRSDAAYAIARRALEITGFARIIAADKPMADLWITSNNDDQTWKLFKKQFGVKKLFPRNEPFWHEVYRRYDFLSKLHHPNPISFSRMEWRPTEDGRLQIITRQTQHKVEESEVNVNEVWSVLDAFALSLAALQCAVESEVKIDGFSQRIVDVVNKINKQAV